MPFGFLDKIFGVDDARDDLRSGAEKAAKEREAAKRAARTELTSARDTAVDTLSPVVEGGDLARERLETFLGLRGEDAQREAFSTFENDPGFQATQDAGIEAIDRSASAGGRTFSGGTLKELFQFGQRGKFSQFQDRLDRLTGLSSTGTQARTNTANLQFTTGQNLADLEFGVGQQKAADTINLSNAIADTRGQGINNLFRIGTEAAKAASGFKF